MTAADPRRVSDGTVAVVTGGGGRMGRATALAFARSGAAVLVADIDVDRGRETAGLAARDGGTAEFLRADVSSGADVEAVVSFALERHSRLDFAVNAAALEFDSARIADCTEADFDRMIAVNLRSVFLSMKYALRAIIAGGRGGAIDTPMLRGAMARRGAEEAATVSRLSPIGRFGDPAEIAEAALWLCSPCSSFVTGHALVVDGGYLAT